MLSKAEVAILDAVQTSGRSFVDVLNCVMPIVPPAIARQLILDLTARGLLRMEHNSEMVRLTPAGVSALVSSQEQHQQMGQDRAEAKAENDKNRQVNFASAVVGGVISAVIGAVIGSALTQLLQELV